MIEPYRYRYGSRNSYDSTVAGGSRYAIVMVTVLTVATAPAAAAADDDDWAPSCATL